MRLFRKRKIASDELAGVMVRVTFDAILCAHAFGYGYTHVSLGLRVIMLTVQQLLACELAETKLSLRLIATGIVVGVVATGLRLRFGTGTDGHGGDQHDDLGNGFDVVENW